MDTVTGVEEMIAIPVEYVVGVEKQPSHAPPMDHHPRPSLMVSPEIVVPCGGLALQLLSNSTSSKVRLQGTITTDAVVKTSSNAGSPAENRLTAQLFPPIFGQPFSK
mmetsp:Transcript_25236/g.66203  ORF Transcript_25236/g.66203 Transcript_25236/m.66203 type:complete len:107 (+) Transcript_25236:986-1306(+)